MTNLLAGGGSTAGSVVTSNTLICEVSRLVEGKSSSSEPFFPERWNVCRVLDLMSVCELFVLYDTVYTLPGKLSFDAGSLSLRSRLLAEGALKELDTSAFHDHIAKAIVGGLAPISEIQRELNSFGYPVRSKTRAIENFLLVGGYEPPLLDADWRGRDFEYTPIEDAESFEEMTRRFRQSEFLITGGYEYCTSILRDMYYICASEQVGLPYWPQFNRLEFARKFPNYWDSFSLRERIYSRLASALSSTVSDVYEDSCYEVAYIPPFSALVLDKCSSPQTFADALLEVRGDYSKLRRQLAALEISRMNSTSLIERRRIRRQQKDLLELAAQSFDKPATVSLEAIIRYIPDVIEAAVSPLNPTKYTEDLLLKPLSWITTWWKQRPISMVFRAANRIAEIERYENLLLKMFGVHLPAKADWKLYFGDHLKGVS